MTHDHDAEHDHEHHHHDLGPKHFIMSTPGVLVDDVHAAADYYRDVLGFDIRFTHGEPTPNFAIVDRGDVSVHIVLSDPPGRRNGMAAAGPGNGNDFYVNVTDIDELYRELIERGAKVLSEPQTWPYGMREFNIQDLNGYRIIFGEPKEAS